MYYGFHLLQGSAFLSQGTPAKPITYVPVSLVQEGPFASWFHRGFMMSFVPDYWPYSDLNPAGDPPPTLDFRFSNFSLNSGPSHHFWTGMSSPFISVGLDCTTVASAMCLRMRDCNLYSGWVNFGEPDGYLITPVDFNGTPITGSVSWVNNLFDRVNLNLDPDTGPVYWPGDAPGGRNAAFPHTTGDLSLTVTNNLFRGGWIYLEPTPTSAGDWIIENSLFDQVAIAQDTYQPLDYDHNAYWANTALQSGQTSQFYSTPTTGSFVDGTGDVTLQYPPKYQTGPLGPFYQAPSSTSGGNTLIGAGSATADTLGFFHYTTQVNQDKCGTTQIDIGLLHIATEGANSAAPRDTDTDGIPDYVEDANGNGQVDANETSWQTQYTVTDVWDPTNSVYDDLDLSGSGLVGRVKRALLLGPFDSSNPLTLSGIEADGMVARFHLPLSYSVATGAGRLKLWIDGEPAHLEGLVPASDGSGTCVLEWNIAYEWPGLHVLQAMFDLGGPAGASTTAISTAIGPALPFNSFNSVRFTEACSQFQDDGATLYSQLPEPEADYTIELRDPSNPDPSAGPFRTFQGHTTTGEIQESWNILREDGSAYSGQTVDAVYTISFTDPMSPSYGVPQPPTPQRLNRVPSALDRESDYFDVAYAYDPSPELDKGGSVWAMMQSIVDILIGYRADGTMYHSSFDNFSSSNPGDEPFPGFLNSDQRKQQLLDDLARARTKNFFFLGHGSPDTIEGGGITISRTDDVVPKLGNRENQRGGYVCSHWYRFVFLEGCACGKDYEWAHAFGIYDKKDQYKPRNIGPQAFVGWKDKVGMGMTEKEGGPIKSWLVQQYRKTWEVFYTRWMNGQNLAACLEAAEGNVKGAGVTLPLAIPGQARVVVGNYVVTRATAALRLVGDPGLTRSDCDRNVKWVQIDQVPYLGR